MCVCVYARTPLSYDWFQEEYTQIIVLKEEEEENQIEKQTDRPTHTHTHTLDKHQPETTYTMVFSIPDKRDMQHDFFQFIFIL